MGSCLLNGREKVKRLAGGTWGGKDGAVGAVTRARMQEQGAVRSLQFGMG